MNTNKDRIIQKLEMLDSRIGSTVEVGKNLLEIVCNGYNTEFIFLKEVEVLTEKTYKIKYNFPNVDLSNKNIYVVDGIQMHLAIFQGIYISVGFYIKNNVNCIIDYDNFLNIVNNSYYRKDNKIFKKVVKPFEDSFLIFEIEKIIDKGSYYMLYIKLKNYLDVFVYGDVELIIAK